MTSTPDPEAPQPQPAPSLRNPPPVPVRAARVPDAGYGASTGQWTTGTQTNPYAGARQDPMQPAARRRGRTALGAVGALVLAFSIGAGGYYAYSAAIGGGGPQPEDVLPASTFAYVKIDLDPSGGQKLDALRFARKFPQAPSDAGKDDADLKKVVFDKIQDEGGFAEVDYANDVQPWLGDRFGIGVLPGQGGDNEVSTVVAIAVEDEKAARAGLEKLTAEGGHCDVAGDFALCSDEESVVTGARTAAAASSLSEAAVFSGDLDRLGEDGLAAFWVDFDKAAPALAAIQSAADLPGETELPRGRMVAALRFDGPHLEVAGSAVGEDFTIENATVATGIGDLPSDTVAALAVGGGADAVKQGWAKIESNDAYRSTLADLESELGLTLPDDLYALLGSQLAIAFGGIASDGETPELGLVTDGDRARVQQLARTIGDYAMGRPLSAVPKGRNTVVALDETYAEVLASSQGGLGDTEAFKAAVPDAGKASYVGYLSLAGLRELIGDELQGDEAAAFDALGGIGMSSSSGRDGTDFRLRLTTR